MRTASGPVRRSCARRCRSPRSTASKACRSATSPPALGMSKSGVYAHFGSKQELQLAAVDEAGRIFHAEVVEPALVAAPGLGAAPRGLRRLLRPPGPADVPGRLLLRGRRPRDGDTARTGQGGGRRLPERLHRADPPVRRSLRSSSTSSPRDEDPDALTFELNGIILAANANFVLRADPAALELARRVVRRRLGVEPSSSERRSSAAPVAAG